MLRTGLALVLLVALNLLLRSANAALELPFFFDSIGTAVAAALYGLWPGMITGVATNGLLEVLNAFQMENFPWAVCSVATAIIVWTMVHTGRFHTVRHAVLGSIVVTLANSVLGALIATIIYDGITGVPLDYVVTALVSSGHRIASATFLARIPSNLIDKTIAVFAAYYAYRGAVLHRHPDGRHP